MAPKLDTETDLRLRVHAMEIAAKWASGSKEAVATAGFIYSCLTGRDEDNEIEPEPFANTPDPAAHALKLATGPMSGCFEQTPDAPRGPYTQIGVDYGRRGDETVEAHIFKMADGSVVIDYHTLG